MVNKIAISDYAKLIGKSRTSIIKMIDKGLLSTGYLNKDGKKIKAIIVENDEILSDNTYDTWGDSTVNTLHKDVTPRIDEDLIEAKNQLPLKEALILNDNQIDRGLSEDFVKQILTYVELAGQSKLLMDSEYRTKEEYFKIAQENKVLLQEKTAIETKLNIQNSQIEELKAKLDKVENKELEELKVKLNRLEVKPPAIIEFLRKL